MEFRLTKLDMKMAEGFPGGIPFPQNVACPNNCKFCFEKNVIKQFPKIKTKYIPTHNEESFSRYVTQATSIVTSPDARMQRGPASPVTQEDGEFYYFRKCDFFSLGLSNEQIELIVKNGAPMTAYTTGHRADPDFITYLCKNYPQKFNLNLSIITLDPAIRSEMMDAHLSIDDLKKVCQVARNSVYFLLAFTKDQIIRDVDILNEWSLNNKNRFSICRLYYSDSSPQEVIEYGKKADDCMAGIIDHFARHRKEYKHLDSRMNFLPDPPAFAWARRRELKELVKDCVDEASSVVICTQGAAGVLKTFFNKAKVVIPETCFGGNIDVALSITLQGVVKVLEKYLGSGVELKNIYLPSNIFSIEGKFDFYLEELSLIENMFPALKFNVIAIPKDLLTFELTLDECIDYYKHMVKAHPERFKENWKYG